MTASPTDDNASLEHRNRELTKELSQARGELSQARGELAEAREQQAATAEILRVISSSPMDLKRVFAEIATGATRLCDAHDATILQVDGDSIRLVAHHGPLPTTAPVGQSTMPLTRGVTSGRAILDRQTIHVADLQAEMDEYPQSSDLARRIGFRTALATPLIHAGEAIGVIGIRRTEVRPFTEKQIELLKTFADQAVIAIENTRLFEAEQASKRELQESLEYQTATSGILDIISRSKAEIQPVFDAIVQSAARLFYPCTATITTLKDGFLHWNGSASLQPLDVHRVYRAQQVYPVPFDPERVPSARAILERRTVVIPDATAPDAPEFTRKVRAAGGFRSIAYVPLVNQDKGIGTIILAHPQPGFELTRKQFEVLETFADQAVIAIENTRLFEEVQAKTGELTEALEQQTATSEVLKVISSSPGELEPVFQIIVENAVRVCDAQFGTLFRYDGKLLHRVAGVGTPPALVEFMEQRGPFLPPLTSRLHDMLQTKQVQHIVDAAADAVPSVAARFGGARSLVHVPMRNDDELVGPIVIYRQEVRPFTDKQIELVNSFAAQAVIAIENVRLLNELRESLQQQTATADVLKVISRAAFDLPRVLDTLVESAATLCDSHDTSIWQKDGDVLRIVSDLTHPSPIGLGSTVPLTRGSATGRAVLDRQTIHLADAQSETDDYPETSALARRFGHHTVLAVPLVGAGEAVGAITLRRPELRPFTDRQIELLRNFADQGVIAIETTRLFGGEWGRSWG